MTGGQIHIPSAGYPAEMSRKNRRSDRKSGGWTMGFASGAPAGRPTDLIRLPGDENPKGLAEEGGEERVEGSRRLQEVVHLVHQARVAGQFLIYLQGVQ